MVDLALVQALVDRLVSKPDGKLSSSCRTLAFVLNIICQVKKHFQICFITFCHTSIAKLLNSLNTISLAILLDVGWSCGDLDARVKYHNVCTRK